MTMSMQLGKIFGFICCKYFQLNLPDVNNVWMFLEENDFQ